MINHFFKKKGPFSIKQLADLSDITLHSSLIDNEILDIKNLFDANKSDITFFHSKKYENIAANTKASFCITTKNLENILPKTCVPLVVENVLFVTAKVTNIFYPDAATDDFDQKISNIDKTSLSKTVKYGVNVLVGENVKFGKKPKPFLPITQQSKIFTLFLIMVFLIITFEPIEQSSPITTLLSIIEL